MLSVPPIAYRLQDWRGWRPRATPAWCPCSSSHSTGRPCYWRRERFLCEIRCWSRIPPRCRRQSLCPRVSTDRQDRIEQHYLQKLVLRQISIIWRFHAHQRSQGTREMLEVSNQERRHSRIQSSRKKENGIFLFCIVSVEQNHSVSIEANSMLVIKGKLLQNGFYIYTHNTK